MLEKDEETWWGICDICGDQEELDDAEGFKQAVDCLKQKDWTFMEINEEWTHTCKGCHEDQLREHGFLD